MHFSQPKPQKIVLKLNPISSASISIENVKKNHQLDTAMAMNSE